jgi:hypothetical protein
MSVSDWNNLDEDDRMGYLQDFILDYAEKNNIQFVEDVWQTDLNCKEFMIEAMSAAGVFVND